MSKFVVVFLPNEAKAYEATRSLKELHGEGSLTVYGMAVIARDVDGNLLVKQAAEPGALGLGVGALTGGLIGLLGGPIGVAVGVGAGALIGGMSDIFNAGVGTDFVKTVSEKLTPGTSAVIAEVTEEWVAPLDTRMDAIGGFVIREWRSDFEDERIEKEANARKAAYAHLKEELTLAHEDRKSKLKADIAEARDKLDAIAKRAQDRIDQFKQETDAKIKELQDQAARAKGEAKAKLDRHIAEVRADYDRRSGKLKQAWEMAKEALS